MLKCLTPLIRKLSVACSLGLCIIIGASIYIHYIEGEKNQLITSIEHAKIERSQQQEYINSPVSQLIQRLDIPNNWTEQVLHTLEQEPLVLSSSEIEDDKMVLRILGSSENFFRWYNKVNEALLFVTIHIVSITTKGSSITFECIVHTV